MHDTRVIDISRAIPGEFCARLLGGYGADVVKVEDASRPSATRSLAPFLSNEPDPENSAAFWHLNGGKRGVSLDLGWDAGRRAFLELVAVADVVVEDRAPGELDELGLGYDWLRAVRPDVVLTSVTPFGQTGPMSGYLATELGVLAAAGELFITGDPGREPVKPGGNLASYAAGLQAAVATCAAVCLQRRLGAGQHLDVSAQEAAGMFICGGPTWFHHFEQCQARVGARVAQAFIRGGYSGNIVQCSDGYLWFGTGHNQDMIALLIEKPELDSPALWQRPGDRAGEIDAAIQGWTASRTREEVTRLAQELHIAVAPVLTLREALDNPQHAARGFFRPVARPAVGDVVALGPPALSDTAPWRVGPAPALGEHNAEVLGGLLGVTGAPTGERATPWIARAARSSPRPTAQPLEGVRVVDLTTNVAGPFGTLVLASLGAEVWKLERPWVSELREAHRVVPPAKEGSPDEPYNRAPWFNEVNRGKRSLAVDLTLPQGRDLLLELVAISDVIVSNFSTRVMQNLGLDYEAVRSVRPDMIYAALSGYGGSGPAAAWSAAGPAIDAASGVAWLTGYRGGPPLRPGNFAPDLIAGMFLSLGILQALNRRRDTGQGDRIDLSMLESMEHVIGGELVAAASGAGVPFRTGNDSEPLAPHGCFPCAGDDAWIVIAVAGDDQWLALIEAMGRPSGRATNASEPCRAVGSSGKPCIAGSPNGRKVETVSSSRSCSKLETSRRFQR